MTSNACVLLVALLVSVAVSAQGSDNDAMVAFQRRIAVYLDVRKAVEGSVFTRAMSEVIRDRLHRAFDDVEVDAMLSSLYGEELPPVDAARVGFGCADKVLAVPPVSVLAALPPVPGMLGYRLAGRDLVLWDEDAAIVVDIVRDALPRPRMWDFVDVSSFELRRLIRESLQRMALEPSTLLEEMQFEAPKDWRPLVGEPFCWGASGPMPPTVLHALPALPPPFEYRFAGSDLVVVDVHHGIVMGVLSGILPRRAISPRA